MSHVVPESTFTAARPDCPHPEWWHAVDAYSTELEVSELVATFVRALQPDLVVETGTCVGVTAGMIGEALVANGHGRLVSLETNERLVEAARAHVAGLPVEVRHESSLDYLPDGPIGFAWLDSLVTLRVQEFERFRPYLAPGAIVGFHDTSPHHGDWGRAVEALPGTRCIRLRTPRGVTFLELTD
jgi:predicted O-methyltransferase YrrM